MAKLKARSPALFGQWLETVVPEVGPMFKVVAGEVEAWERR
jgi:hypothetical protein